MAESLFLGVARILVSDGAVCAQMTPETAATMPSISIGNRVSAMVPMDPADASDLVMSLDYRPWFDPAKLIDAGEARGAAVAELNGLKEWGLPNRDTLQLRLKDWSRPVSMRVLAPIQVPAFDRTMQFSVGLAAHRAGARLVVERRREDTGAVLERMEAEFSVAFAGGVSPQSYLWPEMALQPCPASSRIEMTVLFDRYDGEGDPPFLFVSDPLVKQQHRDLQLAPIRELYRQSFRGDLSWYRADLPQEMSGGETLVLRLGEERHDLLRASPDLKVTLEEEHGHALVLRATEPDVYQVHVDGRYACKAHLGPEPGWVHLPAVVQNGGLRRLTVKDCGGLRSLLSAMVHMPRMTIPLEALQAESTSPFPGPLMLQAGHRHESLKARIASGAEREEMAELLRLIGVLEGGYANGRLEPLAFPEVETPRVSIVIPAHNKVAVTYFALCSLRLAHNITSFEVIVVDDGSTDETARLSDWVSGITIIRHDTPQRFIRACNSGAARARGSFIVLLNNDVEVTSGWLDEMVAAFERFPGAGLVGARLIYPDGRLQDGGGLVFENGEPWNYGQGWSPWDPRVSYARQVDYLSGAALMIPAPVWEDVGGLSAYLEPMYYEDTDLSFKVREAGYETWYVPSSIVYHYEGTTAGRSLVDGFKRYQDVNAPKFKQRWTKAFRGLGREDDGPDLLKDRNIEGRILFVDAQVPRPDQEAGAYAAVQEMRLVQSLGYKVTFLPQNLAHLGHYNDALERLGVEVIYAPYWLSMRDFLKERLSEFDAIYITRYYVAQVILDILQDLDVEKPILFNNADLHFLREMRASRAAGDAEMMARARRTRDAELAVMEAVDVVLSYNEVEHAVIEAQTEGTVRVAKCPWVLDIPETVPGPEDRTGLSFLGNYRHPPNIEAVEWFVRNVMPKVRGPRHGDPAFHVYGAGMGPEVHALSSERVHTIGFVEDVADAYDRHRIFVAPLLSGAGIKGKVLAALAHGIPCVLSPIAAEGIGLRNGHDCLISETPEDWADAIRQLGKDKLWRQVSANARAFVTEAYSFETGRRMMREALVAAGLYAFRD
ncbi:glycosyltransferase [Histidinibacterium lentulum]|nr:glycosyltransferase [Histidinibacterium lentulum]